MKSVDFTGCGKNSSLSTPALKGHGFSRAERRPSAGSALQAAEKLVRAVGQGFIPGTNAAESTRALAPEVCFLPPLTQNRPFSAGCLAPEKMPASKTTLVQKLPKPHQLLNLPDDEGGPDCLRKSIAKRTSMHESGSRKISSLR
jgi:hypothetical protein